jgi:hypothetical protein
MEDSSSIRLPGGPAPAPAAPVLAPAAFHRDDDDDTTIEMEKLDAADLPAFAMSPSLSGLVGPLERRGAPGQDDGADGGDAGAGGLRTVPVRRLEGDRPSARVAPQPRQRPRARPPSVWTGPRAGSCRSASRRCSCWRWRRGCCSGPPERAESTGRDPPDRGRSLGGRPPGRSEGVGRPGRLC